MSDGIYGSGLSGFSENSQCLTYYLFSLSMIVSMCKYVFFYLISLQGHEKLRTFIAKN